MSGKSIGEGVSKALATIASGCAVMTSRSGSAALGMLASWIQQAAFDPPMITVAVKKGRPIEALLNQSRRFVLNVLGEEAAPLMKHFGAGFGPGDDAFQGLKIRETEYGVELADAVAQLSCAVATVADAGDHNVYVAKVVAGKAAPQARPYVHLRKMGLSY